MNTVTVHLELVVNSTLNNLNVALQLFTRHTPDKYRYHVTLLVLISLLEETQLYVPLSQWAARLPVLQLSSPYIIELFIMQTTVRWYPTFRTLCNSARAISVDELRVAPLQRFTIKSELINPKASRSGPGIRLRAISTAFSDSSHSYIFAMVSVILNSRLNSSSVIITGWNSWLVFQA